MIYLIDNYDSFTHNLAQLFWLENCQVRIERNDATTVDKVIAANPSAIVISPGPGRPENAGISEPLIRKAASNSIPLLGVCLGHQAIANAFGGEVTYAPELMHGKVSLVSHNARGLFSGLPSPLSLTRYHSLVVNPKNLPEALQVDAQTDDGVLMALRHQSLPIFGVQFHPESFMSEHGPQIVRNFVNQVRSA